jgi:hypothetical protein
MTNNTSNNASAIPRPEAAPFAPGANSPAQSAYLENQKMYETQANNNKALAGGKTKKNYKRGGGTEVAPIYVPYRQASAGNTSINAQYVNTGSNILQANENATGDKGAYKTGGRRRKSKKGKKKGNTKRRKTHRRKRH